MDKICVSILQPDTRQMDILQRREILQMRLRALNSFIVSFHRLHLHRTSAIVLGEKKKKWKPDQIALLFQEKRVKKHATKDSSELGVKRMIAVRERELMRKGEQKCHVEQYNLRRGNK